MVLLAKSEIGKTRVRSIQYLNELIHGTINYNCKNESICTCIIIYNIYNIKYYIRSKSNILHRRHHHRGGAVTMTSIQQGHDMMNWRE